MSTDPRFLVLSDKFSRLKESRSYYQEQWESIRGLVRPNVPDFFSSGHNHQNRRSQRIYDGTAPWALEQLASGLHSMNVSQTDRWFSLQLGNKRPDEVTDKEKEWLEDVATSIYQEYQKPSSGFNSSVHENFLELAGFGTSVLFQDYNRTDQCIYFRTYPLADCWLDENYDGRIDTCFRRTLMTARQIEQEGFDSPVPPALAREGKANPSRKFEIIHAVAPRTDRDVTSPASRNMRYSSFFFCPEYSVILHEGGYNTFPYHSGRWTKLAGEVYGQSPAGNCLPDIQMVNQMVRTIISSAQKMADPPVVVPNDGFILPIRTSPGSLIYKEPGTEPATAFPFIGQPQLGLELVNQHRGQITRSFYIEHLLRERKRERQSVMEIQDERMEMIQQLGPVNGRIQSEILGPCLARSFDLLLRNDRIPEAPGEMRIKPLYTSQASRSQMAQKSIGIRRWLEEITPLANIDPTILDAVDMPALLSLSAAYEDISSKVMRSPEEIEELREQRAEQQQQQQQSDMAVNTARAAKDMAMAQRV